MLTPEYLSRVMEGAEEIAEALHQSILNHIVERVMIRLARKDGFLLTATDKWNIETLQQLGFLLEEIQIEISKATGLAKTEIREAMEEAGVKTIEYDMEIYKNAGISTGSLTQSPELVRIMQRYYEATMGEWENITRTTAEAAQRLFIKVCDNALSQVLTGAMSPSQAVREAVNELSENGVIIRYPSGHTDTIETATARAVRTGVSQSSAEIQFARMDEMGVDLVLMSSHLGSRPEHAVWQGKIFSRSGTSEIYPDFVSSTGYGSVRGFAGANCGHSASPYFEGMGNPFEQFDSEENKKAYELQQRQRTLERRIRKTKRDVMTKLKAIDNCPNEAMRDVLLRDYQRKAELLRKQNEAYKEFCGENGLKKRQERLEVAKWNRTQAAAARAAASKSRKEGNNG